MHFHKMVTLLLAVIFFAGCGSKSDQGLTWLIVSYGPGKGNSSDKLKDKYTQIRKEIERTPSIKKIEFGTSNNSAWPNWAIGTLKDPNFKNSPEFQEILLYSRADGYVIHPHLLTSIQDVTPNSAKPGSGSVRRLLFINSSTGDDEKFKEVESLLSALPNEVPEIVKLEYAAGQPGPPPDLSRCILFSFRSKSDLEKCNSHSAYQSFVQLLNRQFPTIHSFDVEIQ